MIFFLGPLSDDFHLCPINAHEMGHPVQTIDRISSGQYGNRGGLVTPARDKKDQWYS